MKKSNEEKALEMAIELEGMAEGEVRLLEERLAKAKINLANKNANKNDAQLAFDMTRERCRLVRNWRHGILKEEVFCGVVVDRTKSGKTISVKEAGYPDADATKFRKSKSYWEGDVWNEFPGKNTGCWLTVEFDN